MNWKTREVELLFPVYRRIMEARIIHKIRYNLVNSTCAFSTVHSFSVRVDEDENEPI